MSDHSKDAPTLEAPSSEVDSFAQTVLSGGSDARPIEPSSDVTFDVDRYAVRRVIGAGGMGEVRLCSDAWIGRDVAMKVAHPVVGGGSAARTRGRFVREARVQGQLEHPSIVPVYDIGKLDQEPFFTMKRIGGHTLEQIVAGLRDGVTDICSRYNRRKLLSAMSQVCLTIAYAHSRGVVHRDLKPANVMLGDFGEVYVLDWGVAKLVASDDREPAPVRPVIEPSAAVTQAGAVIGTPGYMSPEQLRGDPITASTYIYALGAMLFELLVLAPMNEGSTLESLFAATMERSGSSEHAVARGWASRPGARGDIVLRACASRCQKPRHASARAMQEAIEAFLDGERDAERRRELASGHVTRAREALARADRVEAMRELGRAVALDPSDGGALRTISDLVLAPADDLPESAKEEIALAERRDRANGARRAARMYLVWLGILPLVWAMGIESWPAVIVLGSLMLMTSAYAQWVSMAPERATPLRVLPSMLLNCALIATCSTLFGPLIIVPASPPAALQRTWSPCANDRGCARCPSFSPWCRCCCLLPARAGGCSPARVHVRRRPRRSFTPSLRASRRCRRGSVSWSSRSCSSSWPAGAGWGARSMLSSRPSVAASPKRGASVIFSPPRRSVTVAEHDRRTEAG